MEPIDRLAVEVHRDHARSQRGPPDARDDPEVGQPKESGWPGVHAPPSRGAAAAAWTVRDSHRSLSPEVAPVVAIASKWRMSAAQVGAGACAISRLSSGPAPGPRRPQLTRS